MKREKEKRKKLVAIGNWADIPISLRSHVRKCLQGNVLNSDRKFPGNGSLKLVFLGA
jgi:hypothetical protein